MARLAVYALTVLGFALIVFAFWVVRDEAPRWTRKVRRPMWALGLALAAFVAAYVVDSTRFDMNEAVRDHVGERVICEEIGAIDVESHQRTVYSCVRDGAVARRFGCFARVEDEVLDVTRRVEELGALPGTTEC